VLDYLCEGPKKIIAVDMNLAQLHTRDMSRSRRPIILLLALYAAAMFPGVQCASSDSWVTPQTAGKMTHVMTLPRVTVQTTPSACPWDEAGLVAWTPPSGSAPNYTLPVNSKVLINADATVGNVVIPADSELVFANTDVERFLVMY